MTPEQREGETLPEESRGTPRKSRAPRRGRDVARIFVAVYPPGAIVDALHFAAAGLPDLPPHRLVPRAQIHLTAQFVGDVDRRDLEAVIETVERAAAGIGPFEIAVDRGVTLPKRGPSRLVAATAPEVPRLATLHRRLADRLARRSNRRETFLPHLTLLRFRSPNRDVRLDLPIEVDPFAVDRISVVRSVLRPEGADHRVLAEVDLSGK